MICMLVIGTAINASIHTIQDRLSVTHTRIKGFLDSFLQFWPQLRDIHPQQSLEYPNWDRVMRIHGSGLKSIEGMF